MTSINNPVDNDSIIVKLKSTFENREHEVTIPSYSSATVEMLKSLTYQKLSVSHEKNIRLIYLGKLLDPPSMLLSTFNVKSGAYIHVAVSEKRSSTGDNQHNHTSTIINPPHVVINIAPRSALRGLDILTSYEHDDTFINPLFRSGYGLSVNEVAALRSSFRPTIDEFIQDHHNEVEYTRQAAEDDVSYRLRMEMLWLQSLSEESEFYMNLPQTHTRTRVAPTAMSRLQRLYGMPAQDDGVYDPDQQALGSYHDYTWGFIMGFFLGFIAIFCIWDRNITQRQRLGLICGVTANMAMNIINPPHHVSHTSSSSAPSASSGSEVPTLMPVAMPTAIPLSTILPVTS